MAMRWKKDPPETGLRAVGARPPSHWLRDGVTRLVCASPTDRDGSRWYWVAGWDSGLPHMNTCGEPVATVEQAKADAMAYVRKHAALIKRAA